MRAEKNISDVYFVGAKHEFENVVTNEVRGASVKVIRASSGSCGKNTSIDEIDYRPEEEFINWVDLESVIYSACTQTRLASDQETGMVEAAYEYLYKLLQPEPIEILPEFLVSDNLPLRTVAKRLIDEANEKRD